MLVIKSALVSSENRTGPRAGSSSTSRSCKGSVLNVPTRDQIDMDIQEQLIVELYSK